MSEICSRIGVFLGENAKRLLVRDPSLTWVGVDAYYDSSGPDGADINGVGAEGANGLFLNLGF